MIKVLATLALLLVIPVTSPAQIAGELVGTYRMDVEGGDILDLRVDGTASIAGEETGWSADGSRISIGPDVMQYRLLGDRLLLMSGTLQIAWIRIGGAAKAAPTKRKEFPGASADKSGTGEAVADREAKQVLTGTAWCSFTYSKVSGTSTTRKVVFRPDGVMTVKDGAETYSSGYGGTYAGQSDSAGAMRWKLENLRLFVDQGGGAGFQDIGLTASRNSNGYVILNAGGREYSMCR